MPAPAAAANVTPRPRGAGRDEPVVATAPGRALDGGTGRAIRSGSATVRSRTAALAGWTNPLDAVSEVVMGTDHPDDLRRRLAERTTHDSTDDRVTTDRLTSMRRRLGELERTSENSTDAGAVMAAEEEALDIMDSLENVRDLRSPKGPLS
jgi:hypothetical protein